MRKPTTKKAVSWPAMNNEERAAKAQKLQQPSRKILVSISIR